MNVISIDSQTLNLDYSTTQSVIKDFVDYGIVNEGNYSVLFYEKDGFKRIKLELMANDNLNNENLMKIMSSKADVILNWQLVENDKQNLIKIKCLATQLRERIIQGRKIEDLLINDWVDGIKNNLYQYLLSPESIKEKLSPGDYYLLTEFLHFILNPLGNNIEEKIRDELKLTTNNLLSGVCLFKEPVTSFLAQPLVFA